MAKNNVLRKNKAQETEGFDFSELMMGSQEEDMMMGMMSGLIEASRHQMNIAIELTKLAVEKNVVDNFDEDTIFSIFQRASQVVSDSSPIKEFWEQNAVTTD